MASPDSIAVIGLGYVGLPLALHFVQAGVPVLGLDTDPLKIEALLAGQSYIHHVPADRIRALVGEERFRPSTDFSQVSGCSAVIICVPTPLDQHRSPDLGHVLKTARDIAPHLKPGTLVVLESTTYPGTTDTELRKELEQGSGLEAGKDFHLAYSPEREDPGNPASRMPAIPKVVGGLTGECLERARALYGRIVEQIVPVSSCRVAEAVKLTENIFRSVNIAMVNELKLIYEAMGLDVWEIVEAAKTKPFGFMAFHPGPGLGGHCIPIDPFYLSWKAREYGQPTRFIELAGEINTAMPDYVLKRLHDALESIPKTFHGANILLLGVAYKSDVDDDRESPAYVLWKKIEERGAEVSFHDPYIPVIRPSREHSRFAGRRSVELTPEVVAMYDAVVLVTRHNCVDYEMVAGHANRVVDTRNALRSWLQGSDKYFKA